MLSDMAQEFAMRFYASAQWIKCRAAYARSVFHLCEECHGLGEIVHHKIWLTPENINNPVITLGWDNLMLLCRRCHNTIHGQCGSLREDVMFDEYGRLVRR